MYYSEQFILSGNTVTLSDFLAPSSKEETVEEIYNGLLANQKSISSRFFYNEKGSELFEQITALPEYYLTRTEIGILRELAPRFMSTLSGKSVDLGLVELGSGDPAKITVLLDEIPWEDSATISYYPVDVSESAILKSADVLMERYPDIQLHGLLADFLKHLEEIPGTGIRLVCFFGSTIGNLSRGQSTAFLTGLKDKMRPGDILLLGLDMVKEKEVMEAAYNDSQGVTEAFNRNILHAVNGLAGTDFKPEHFRHLAYYNAGEMRIEMHLEADRDMIIKSPWFAHPVKIEQGETIHTENSHKFTTGKIKRMAWDSGLKLSAVHTDDRGWFTLACFSCPGHSF